MEELSFKESLFKELSEFARENLKALEPAEQWLKDGDFENQKDVWQRAKEPFNWQRIVDIAWRASDKKIYTDKIDGFDPLILCPNAQEQEGFLSLVILEIQSQYEPHPSLSLIRNALEEGKKAVAEQKAKLIKKSSKIEKRAYELYNGGPKNGGLKQDTVEQRLKDEFPKEKFYSGKASRLISRYEKKTGLIAKK